jgi:tetratricopeptide (TPR) repeat protein
VHRGNAAAFDQAVAALRSGRLLEAEVLLQEITVDQPELAGPWVNLGQVYVMLEQFEDARRAFSSAIVANPRSCAAHNQLGVLSRQFGDFRSAEEHYRTCLEQVPNFKDAYLNLGILYELYLGRLPEALEAYRRYQLLAAEPDRKVRGWVMDLERRLGV